MPSEFVCPVNGYISDKQNKRRQRQPDQINREYSLWKKEWRQLLRTWKEIYDDK